jgi:hypothetical protein
LQAWKIFPSDMGDKIGELLSEAANLAKAKMKGEEYMSCLTNKV